MCFCFLLSNQIIQVSLYFFFLPNYSSVLYFQIRGMIDFNKAAARNMILRNDNTEGLISKLDALEGTTADLTDIMTTLEENLRVIKCATAVVCVCMCEQHGNLLYKEMKSIN